MAWWMFLQNGLKQKAVRLPLVIGNCCSHPDSQAEFRSPVRMEQELLGRVGARLS
jgi:hypothetical protein